jgi:hypothetical protein
MNPRKVIFGMTLGAITVASLTSAAWAHQETITNITSSHQCGQECGTTITIYLSDTRHWDYTWQDKDPDEPDAKAVRSWQVGDTVDVDLVGSCFMSTQLSNRTRNQSVCFIGMEE